VDVEGFLVRRLVDYDGDGRGCSEPWQSVGRDVKLRHSELVCQRKVGRQRCYLARCVSGASSQRG